jgi:hypothetical protein
MKYQVISLLAMMMAANGELLRSKEDTEKVVTKTLASLELDDEGIVEFLEEDDAIFIAGTGLIEEGEKVETLRSKIQELGPVKAYEELTGSSPPVELVEAQKRVEKAREKDKASKTSLTPPPPLDVEEGLALLEAEDEDKGGRRRLSYCRWFYYVYGNAYVTANTNEMGGRIEPITGCLTVAVHQWTGSYWRFRISRSACAGGYAWVLAWGPYATYKVSTYYASGDTYDMMVCW